VRAQATPVQRQFIDHPAKYKAALCSRRAGKSFGPAGLNLIERALTFPNTKHMYLALTRESAKRILWDDVLKTICREVKLFPKFNETELAVRFDNGSTIYLLGADAKAEEQQKLLGQKYKTIVIDEAGSFRIDLRRLVFKILEPATIDGDGIVCLIGTPGDFIGPPDDRHLFFAATSGARRGEPTSDNEDRRWTSFRWNTFDNPHMAGKWEAALNEKLATTPHFSETVEYQTEWLGEWAVDLSKLVYKFDEKKNLIAAPPEGLTGYVIGIDLGYNDATAFHVWGWRPHDNHLYGLKTIREKGQTLDWVAQKLDELRKEFPQAKMVVDGAAKQAVEHLRRVYHQPLKPAAKAGKIDFIRHMNTDLQTERIKVVRSTCGPLIAEWAALIWDDRARIPVEKDGCDNHACDAALYSWRESLHYTARPKPSRTPDKWSAEYAEEWLERASAKNAAEEDDD
jgi:hypothetical protein